MIHYKFVWLSFNQSCEAQTELCIRNTYWHQDIDKGIECDGGGSTCNVPVLNEFTLKCLV